MNRPPRRLVGLALSAAVLAGLAGLHTASAATAPPSGATTGAGTVATSAAVRAQVAATVRAELPHYRAARRTVARSFLALMAKPRSVQAKSSYTAAVAALPAAAARDGLRLTRRDLTALAPLSAAQVIAAVTGPPPTGVSAVPSPHAAPTATTTSTPTPSPTPTATPPTPATPPGTVLRRLPLRQHPQLKRYYCGPSAAQTMAEYLRPTSAKDGAAPSQALFADNGYLRTEATRATAWASRSFAPAMNRYLGSPVYLAEPAPSATALWESVVYDLASGIPVAVDLVYFRGATLVPAGHPNDRTRGHWVVLDGWRADKTVTYLDPMHASTTLPWGAQVPERSRIPLADLTRLAATNGIVW